ncbi:branched-chain amino acid ABC transporter permease [Anaerococcus sp. AGMB00486]|uniref:Branched-chain amino acid ABC transporter permease n=2 Tax=Anaerococcus TaxID=165779 RepID=A0ABX2N8H4_9FIRM|nr:MULTISPECIES: branched-chain amino acid ABC transporter permease [Anaerococcus]MDY3005432.1 branched-chain amino acid ABC transporter permease [Anaerococcus porci]MSS77339.1 branched-chain amino acid ABC transporter permease [Anaerococcus porci]NVF10859.1 branched-chain amino acid ABC transporter permease [Anaerococcus faecalis]
MDKNKKISYIATTLLILLTFVIIQALIIGGVIDSYWQAILFFLCINIILSISLNITVGNLGQITLGHAGFMSIGAYTAGIFLKTELVGGVGGFIISLLLAGLVAFLFSLIIGIPVLRLNGDYLAIVTLAFGEIIRVLAENLTITGGAQGMTGIPTIDSFALVFFVTVLSVVFMYSIMTSRFGRSVLAIKDNELAAESSGVNTTRYKTFAFTLSALFAGVAGAIYAQTTGVIAAGVFNYNKSFDILVMVVLGGMGSFTGSIISTIVLTIVPEILRAFADWRMIIYSVILVLVMIFRPQGLMGREEFSISRLLAKIKRKKALKKEKDDGK